MSPKMPPMGDALSSAVMAMATPSRPCPRKDSAEAGGMGFAFRERRAVRISAAAVRIHRMITMGCPEMMRFFASTAVRYTSHRSKKPRNASMAKTTGKYLFFIGFPPSELRSQTETVCCQLPYYTSLSAQFPVPSLKTLCKRFCLVLPLFWEYNGVISYYGGKICFFA